MFRSSGHWGCDPEHIVKIDFTHLLAMLWKSVGDWIGKTNN